MYKKKIEELYSELIRQANLKLKGSFRNQLSPSEVVSDVVYMILERAEKNKDKFNMMVEKGEFTKYIFFILNQNCRSCGSPSIRDIIKRQKREISGELKENAAIWEESTYDAKEAEYELVDAILAILNKDIKTSLTDEKIEMLTLYYINGFKSENLGRMYGFCKDVALRKIKAYSEELKQCANNVLLLKRK